MLASTTSALQTNNPRNNLKPFNLDGINSKSKFLDLSFSTVTKEDLRKVAAICTELKSLRLKSCPNIDFSSLSIIFQEMHSLNQVDLTGCEEINPCEITPFHNNGLERFSSIKISTGEDFVKKTTQKNHEVKKQMLDDVEVCTEEITSTKSIEDFKRFDMRVGTITTAILNKKARVPAYKLEIDFGNEVGLKTSSAQLTRNYAPEDLIGKKIIGVVNLEPKKIAGVKSEVLVLGSLSDEAGTFLLAPDATAENGLKIG